MRIPSSAIIPLIVFIISLFISPNNNKNNQKNQKKEKKEKSNKNKQKFDNVNKNFANKNSNNSNTTKTGGQSQFKSNQKSNAKAQTKTSYSNDTEMDEYYIKRERNRHNDKKNNPIYGYSYDEDKELFDLKNAIIYSEILQKPLALRK